MTGLCYNNKTYVYQERMIIMLKKMICALLCLVLVGSVLPASALAAGPDGSFELTLEYPEDWLLLTNLIKADGKLYGYPGAEYYITIGSNTPLVEIDHWETEGLSLTEEQRTSDYIRFKMPEGPVSLRAVTRETICPFTDVPRDSWYYVPVLGIYQAGTMSGTSDTTFSPTEYASRAQIVTCLSTLCAGGGGYSDDWNFTDVPRDSWFYKKVCWAVGTGVAAGVSDTEFAPYAPVTRAQFIQMLYKRVLWPHEPDHPTTDVPFTDVPENAYYREALSWAVKENIVSGKEANLFAPNDPCTRAEIAVMLYNCKY